MSKAQIIRVRVHVSGKSADTNPCNKSVDSLTEKLCNKVRHPENWKAACEGIYHFTVSDSTTFELSILYHKSDTPLRSAQAQLSVITRATVPSNNAIIYKRYHMCKGSLSDCIDDLSHRLADSELDII